jgi:hypothetical protein
MREDYCTLWVARDGRLAVGIRPADGTHKDDARYPYRVTVYRGLTAWTHADDCSAQWYPRDRKATSSTNASERLDRLVVELGAPVLGQSYTLMFARQNTNADNYGGLNWVPVHARTPVTKVEVFPELGASYMEAVLGYHDDIVQDQYQGSRWTQPYEIFRVATAAERALLHAALEDAAAKTRPPSTEEGGET